MLANVYLHYVLDVWFEQEVRPRLAGCAFMIRYADDFVIVFSSESDARRVMEVLPKRFGKYGLTLHPDKTRLVSFRRPDDRNSSSGRPGAFDLLGFTHYWGKFRKGEWTVKRKTSSSRLTRGLRAIGEWCRKHRHHLLPEQHVTLSAKVRGHYAYYGITGNSSLLSTFLMQVHRRWRYWLSRRNREKSMTWDCFNRLLRRSPLPSPVVVHSVYRTTRSTRDQRNRMH
jgi:RNA-directed DNA polymerase